MRRYLRLEILNVGVSWYNVAVIWLMQTLIYPLWAYLPTTEFGAIQGRHFWWLFALVFPQAALATVLSVRLLRTHPPRVPLWTLRLGVAIQVALWVLTAAFWGRWQAQIALPDADATSLLGPADYGLYELLVNTHWLRVGLITLYALLASWVVIREIGTAVRQGVTARDVTAKP